MQTTFSNKFSQRAIAPLFFVVALILAGATAAAAQTSSLIANRELQLWNTFSPANGGFKVDLPQEPQRLELLTSQDEVASTAGYELVTRTAKYQIFSIQLAKPSANFEQAKEVAQELAKQVPSGSFMVGDTWIVTHQQNLNSNVLSEELTAEKDGNSTRIKRFLTKNVYYQLQVTTPVLRGAPPQIVEVFKAEADKFFNSFEILDNKTQVVRSAKGKAK